MRILAVFLLGILGACASFEGGLPDGASAATDGSSNLLPQGDHPRYLTPSFSKSLPEDFELIPPAPDLKALGVLFDRGRASPRTILPRKPRSQQELEMIRPVPLKALIPVVNKPDPVSAKPASGAAAPVAVPAAPGAQPPRTPAAAPRPATQPPRIVPREKEPDLTPVRPPEAQPKIEYEDVTARVGDEVYFQFTPSGSWVFDSQASRTGGIVFNDVTEERNPPRSVFKFTAKEPGTWELQFKRQNLDTGAMNIRQIRVQVLDSSSRVMDQQVQPAALGDILTRGEALERSGKDREALGLYLGVYDPLNSELNWRIGGLYAKARDPQEARKYWERNLVPENSWGEASWKELLKSWLGPNTLREFLSVLEMGQERGFQVPEDLLLRGAELALNGNLTDEARKLISYGERTYPSSRKKDLYLYLQAQALEKQGPGRDIKRSLELYRTIVAEYPLSTHWTRAKNRAEELDRQFFRIR